MVSCVAWTVISTSVRKVLPGPLFEDVDIQFHASHVNMTLLFGTER